MVFGRMKPDNRYFSHEVWIPAFYFADQRKTILNTTDYPFITIKHFASVSGEVFSRIGLYGGLCFGKRGYAGKEQDRLIEF